MLLVLYLELAATSKPAAMQISSNTSYGEMAFIVIGSLTQIPILNFICKLVITFSFFGKLLIQFVVPRRLLYFLFG